MMGCFRSFRRRTQKTAKAPFCTDYTQNFLKKDVDRFRGFSVLAYLGLLILIPILTEPDSPYVRFHVNQGLVLLIAYVLWEALSAAAAALSASLGGIAALLLQRLYWADVIFVILMFLGVFHAARGQAKELPLIGKIRILK